MGMDIKGSLAKFIGIRSDSTKSEDNVAESSPSSSPEGFHGNHHHDSDSAIPGYLRTMSLPAATNNNNGGPMSPTAKPADMELLMKLDEANRQLEADRRSLSVLKTHSRTGSMSSVKSNTSVSSNHSNYTNNIDELTSNPDELWETWGKLVNDWDTVAKRKASYIRELVRRGVPHHFRGIVWQLLCNAHDCPIKAQYSDLLKVVSPCEKMIRRDITRTYPEHNFFREKNGLGQESLYNVMKAFSLHDREVGYCQGSGFIVGLILMQMPEEEAFAVTVKIMQDYKMRDIFKPSMAELGLCMFQLECMIQEHLPALYSHFQTHSFYVSMFASSWFLTLFTQTLPIPVACRIFDVFLVEGLEMIFRVGFAILQICHDELLYRDMEGMIKYLQKDLPATITQDPDGLLNTAFQIKFNAKKMKKLEKEYNALKSKEQEEQVELRRLRTENRLLRQRIENLEKETGTLADRLIQDQVKYAQQEEEIFILRRDLSVTRQQNHDVSAQLSEIRDKMSDTQSTTSTEDGPDGRDPATKDETISALQQELTSVRSQASESTCTLAALQSKIQQLESDNEQLTSGGAGGAVAEPAAEVQRLQEQLIVCKLREAEANLSLKELQMKVNELAKHWQRHQDRANAAGAPPSKPSKDKLAALADDLMAVRVREAQGVAELKETKLRLMELETEKHICQRQIARQERDNAALQESVETWQDKDKEQRKVVTELQRKITNMEGKTREDEMMARIRDAEHTQTVAEMRRRVAELEIENQELMTSDKLQGQDRGSDLVNKVGELQEEVLQLKMARRLHSLSSLALNSIHLDSESEDIDLECESSRLHLTEDEDEDIFRQRLVAASRPRVLLDTDDESDSAAENSDPQQHQRRVLRRHKRRSGKSASSQDADRTPTQDSVNDDVMFQSLTNGAFTAEGSNGALSPPHRMTQSLTSAGMDSL